MEVFIGNQYTKTIIMKLLEGNKVIITSGSEGVGYTIEEAFVKWSRCYNHFNK